MFTLNCIVRQSGSLAQRPSLIQHIMATAVVQAVSTLSGVEVLYFVKKSKNFMKKLLFRIFHFISSGQTISILIDHIKLEAYWLQQNIVITA